VQLYRRAARRRRALRVVEPAPFSGQSSHLIFQEEREAFFVGLRAAWLLSDRWPDLYQEHVAQEIADLPLLFGCMVALRQLVELAGVPLRGSDYHGYHSDAPPYGDTPADTLTMFNAVGAEYMIEYAHMATRLRPRYYGLGAQGLLDAEQAPDVLTVLLWHLFSATSWAMGAIPPFEQLSQSMDEDIIFRIDKIKRLPSDAPLNLLACHLDVPEARQIALELAPDCPDGQVIATKALLEYAFARTGNALADHSDYEVEAIHMGETDEEWDWTMLPRMAQLAREAEALEGAYGAWAGRVGDNPEREIPKVAGAIHKAARAAERELVEGPKTLIELLHPDEEEVFV
jgi:hypothetical protein